MASFLAASLLFALIVSASNITAALSPSAAVNGNITSTAQEMQRARYFTFVMLIRMVQEKIPHNTTFLMPNDRMLSTSSIPESQVLEFLSRHFIPAPLMFDDLIRLPNGTIVPTAHSSQTITITNVEHQKLYFNNVELTSPDISPNMSSATSPSMQPAAESPQSSDTSTSKIEFSYTTLILVLIFSIF